MTIKLFFFEFFTLVPIFGMIWVIVFFSCRTLFMIYVLIKDEEIVRTCVLILQGNQAIFSGYILFLLLGI